MKKNLKKIAYYTLLIGLLIILTFSIFTTKQTKQEHQIKNEIPITENINKTSEEDTIENLFSEDTDLEYYRDYYHNDEIIARLEIPNLMNILITKNENNDYYLNHSIDKEYDTKGTEYMDFRVTPLSKQVNIYGHNSRTYDLAFRKLENFLDEDFFNKNEYILLQHDNGKRIYKIFSIKEVKTDYTHMDVEVKEKDFLKHIENLKKDSIFERKVEYNEKSNILVLQTCSYENKNAYYIISAIEITEDTK